jgi:two-component system, OmpR family, sensor histidine kinase MprB
MSLRWRWALTLALVAIGAVAVVAVAAGALTARGLRAEVDRSLLQRAASLGRTPLGELAGGLPGGPGRGGRGNLLRPLVGLDVEVQVLDETGEVVFAYADGPVLPVSDVDLAVAAGRSPSVVRTVTAEGADYRMVSGPLRSGAIQLARDLTPVENLVARLARRILLVGLAAAAAAAAVGWWLAGRAVRPIEDLTVAAEHIAGTQDLSATVPAGGPDEVGRLSTSFGTMLGALRSSREEQRRLVSNAGHELRTPLTGLRTNLEVLRRRPDLPVEARTELVDAALTEVAELASLTGELVDLATDAARSAEQPVTALLGDLTSPVVERYRRLLGRRIDQRGTGLTVTVRPSHLERAVGNLLDNAAKWSPDGTPIDVVLDGTAVTVRDRGPGIDDVDLPHVFDRFYRAPSARSMPGSGLGLAIVEQSIEANGGTVFARNHPDGGAEVGFVLPAGTG